VEMVGSTGLAPDRFGTLGGSRRVAIAKE